MHTHRVTLLALIATTVGALACGGDGPAPPVAPVVPTPVVPAALVTGDAVNVLNPGRSLLGVSVRTSSEQVLTGSDGIFRLTIATPPSIALTLSATGFVDRSTQAPVPGTVHVSLIPSNFDLAAFEQFAPRIGGLRRWTTNPRVLFLKSVVDYAPGGDMNVTDRELSQAVVDCTLRHVSEDIETLSGGTLKLAGVDVVSLTPRSRFGVGGVPEGTIVMMGARSLGANGRGAGYVGGPPWVLVRGAVWLNADDLPFCTAQSDFVVLHELGHAFGYAPNHVTAQPSVMGSPPSSGITTFDRDAIAIVYQRPPGNRAPDVDPPGAVLAGLQR